MYSKVHSDNAAQVWTVSGLRAIARYPAFKLVESENGVAAEKRKLLNGHALFGILSSADIDALLLQRLRLFEHPVGFAGAGSVAEKHLQTAATRSLRRAHELDL